MKPVDRQKICPNCDGRIAYDATQCQYCFTTLQTDNSSPKLFNTPPSQDNLSTFYTPPYSTKPASEPAEPKIVSKNTTIYTEKESTMAVEKTETEDAQSFLPVLLLTLGGNLFTLGILQFFFSDRGIIHLEINGSYWFLMLLVSLPLFYFGLKKAAKD